MKKLLLSVLLMAGLNAHAVQLKTIEDDGLYDIYYSSVNDTQFNSGAGISTHSVVGTLLSFVIEAVGSDVLFSLSHSTGFYTKFSDTDTYRTFVGSSRTIVRSGTSKSFDVRGYVQDPWIRIYSLTGNVTAHVTIDYIMPLSKSSTTVTVVR